MGILQLLARENYIAYHKTLANVIGVDEAILFGELCSMNNMYGDEFFCEQSKLMNDTCLTEYRIRNALKNLQKANLVSVTKKGLPAKNYYILNEDKLLEMLDSQSTSGTKFDSTADTKFDNTCTDSSNSTFNKNTGTKNTGTKKENNIYTTEFETLWKLYPRKLGKPKALKSYEKARKKGTTFEEVEQGLKAYCKQIEAQKTATEYIKHGSTWFNGECWNDEYEVGTVTETKKEEPKRYGGTYL